MIADLPVGLADPVEALHVISAQMDGMKESHQAVAAEALTALTGFAPPMLSLALGMRLGSKAGQRNVNTVTTNVPGPQIPLYVLGRRMLKAFPYVPLGRPGPGGRPSSSTTSRSTSGVTGDFDAAPDIDVLCHGIDDTMAALLKQAGR